MKFTPSKNGNQLTKSDSSVLLLGVINISADISPSDFQQTNSTPDQSIDHKQKGIKYNEPNKETNNQKPNNVDLQKSKANKTPKYDKADTNYVNFDEEDQMVSSKFEMILSSKFKLIFVFKFRKFMDIKNLYHIVA